MIDLLPTDEQKSIADGVAAFLRDALPISRFRGGARGETDAHWAELAALGAFGISVPEAAGGVGLSVVEDVLAFREFGRHLLSPAVLATRMAAVLSAASGDHALCEALLSGQTRAGLVLSADGEGRVLDVRAGDLAVLISPEAVQVYAPEALEGLAPLEGLDPTVVIGRARLRGAPLLESRDPAVAQSAILLSASLLCGQLEATRDMAADYAKTRVQFGKQIGVFQAVKHRCVDIGLAAQAAWAQTAYAALMLQAQQPDAAFHVANAKMLAGEGALEGARANIQIHGGMGFTDEVDAHLLLKRAHLLRELFIDPRAAPMLLLDMTLDI